MSTVLPDADWTALAEILARPAPDISQTAFTLTLADEGYTQPDGSWRARLHRLDVRLHPFGIGNLRDPHGGAHCTCEFWNEWNWQTGRTPSLLPYSDLATWIAGHAAQVGAPESIAVVLSGIPVLRALADGDL